MVLYFADASGTMFVPVQRSVTVVDNRVAQAAVEALIAGPRNGLQRLVLSDARLLGIQIADGTATVNFDRRPTGAGDNRGLLSIMYTLIEFPSITRVQVQVNGGNIGVQGDGPIAWRPINALNPAALPQDNGRTAYLPLYFVANSGRHDVRVIRMVPKTNEVARATVLALIEGPMEYGDRVWSPIPGDTELRGIKKDGSTIIVDFTPALRQRVRPRPGHPHGGRVADDAAGRGRRAVPGRGQLAGRPVGPALWQDILGRRRSTRSRNGIKNHGTAEPRTKNRRTKNEEPQNREPRTENRTRNSGTAEANGSGTGAQNREPQS